MWRRHDSGWLEVISGPMFSGKSEELIRRVTRSRLARIPVQTFKPAVDTRYAIEQVVSHSSLSVEATPVEDSDALLRAVDDATVVIGVDEAQFFDQGLAELVNELADAGVRVIVAGLDQDFRRSPFGPMPHILSTAEFVDKVHAICVRCGAPAHYSQRIAGGGEQVQVGDTESYEARCRRCYQEFRPVDAVRRVAVAEDEG